MEVLVRWMIRRDMPHVIEIEKQSFEFPWDEEDFLSSLRNRNVIGMVCENKETSEIVGYMIYELHEKAMNLISFCVSPQYRRQKVGTSMIEKLKDKLSLQKRTNIHALVRETSLGAQLFFSKNGFICTKIVKNPYDETDEDGFFMDCSIASDDYVKTNRISDYYTKD